MGRLDRSFPARFPLTTALLAVNTIIYVLMVLALKKASFNAFDVIKYGASEPSLIWEGEIWRLLSSSFLHGGWMHLGMNMYFLYMIGPHLEQRFGTARYAAAYFGAALGGSILPTITSAAPVVGASGALMGVVGAMVGWGIVEHHRLKSFLRTPEGSWVKQFVVIMVLFSLLWGRQMRLSHAGHIGGALLGFPIGYYFAKTLAKSWKQSWHQYAVGGGIIAVLLAGTIYTQYPIGNAKFRRYQEQQQRILQERPMSQIGIAMIGCGGISRAHAGAYNQMDDANVIAVVDLDEERREQTQADVGATLATGDYKEAIAADGVDVVDICLPSHLHEPVALEAFSAGKHVFCEKPITLEYDATDRMIAAAAESDRRLAVGYVLRFDAKFAKVRELVQAGAIGRPAMFRVTISGSGPTGAGREWYMDAAKGGGPLIDKATHLYDFACYCFGEPESIYAVTPKYRSDCTAVDTGAMILRFKSGDAMTMYLSWGLPEGVRGTYDQDLVGPAGRLEFSAPAESLVGKEDADAVTISGAGGVRYESFPKNNRMVTQFEDFFDAIRNGRAPLNDGAAARQTLAIGLGMIESGKSGAIVSL